MTTTPSLLLVDDDRALGEMLCDYLQQQGYQTQYVPDGNIALETLQRQGFDLIVLDVMMPGPSGLELLPMIRSQWQTPVIMVTGRGDDIDRIIGLEMGADDYIAKPCNPRELAARIQAVLRRSSQPSPQPSAQCHSHRGIELDPGRRSASANGQDMLLTTVEFDLLYQLLLQAGKAVSKDHLCERALHRKLTPYDRSVDVHISRLRHKLKTAGLDPELIKTVRGQGYQLVD